MYLLILRERFVIIANVDFTVFDYGFQSKVRRNESCSGVVCGYIPFQSRHTER